MNRKKLLTGIFLAINVFVLLWSVNYLISYAAQDKLVAIPFGIIFSTALYGINTLVMKLINDQK